MARIELQDVTKRFDDVTAVEGLTIELRDGEFVVLVGPSGCGKSTTLRLISGLETVSAGRVRIGDRDVTDLDAAQRGVSMVFQDYALFPHMTARRNITFGITSSNDFDGDEIDRRVDEAARTLDIEDLLDRKPSELSGGEQQRVAIGRTLVRDPDVFLMDEPLSNLDAKLRVQMRAELQELHRELGTTTVYVTHDQEEAMTLADRVVVMAGGEIMQVDPPQRLYDYPDNQFVAEFIGSPSMNVVPVAVERGRRDGEYVAVHRDFEVPLPAKPSLEPVVGEPANFGVRPEDATPVDAPTEYSFDIEVSVTENLGDELLILGSVGDRDVRVRSENPREEFEPGETVHVECDPDRLHLFDPETGEALYHSEGAGEGVADPAEAAAASRGSES
ncbi:ABC transporter ATP-binding protein [Halobaculum sp. EA56]|uniref:ABC transporter ATP-binding protein n=1 Tax=Halobaculum sp. EA56 TaxID=3421648 RepID=UPI003EB6CE28